MVLTPKVMVIETLMKSNNEIKQWNQTMESMESNNGIKQWNQTMESNNGIKQWNQTDN